MTNSKDNLIAKRYSDALLSLVRENNADVQNINSQLKSIKEVLVTSSDLSSFLSNPIISAEDKKDVVSKLLNDKVDVILINFIKLLIDKERFFAFEEISNIFDAEVDNLNNIQKVSVTSAIELNENLKNRLIEKLSYKLNKNIELVTNVDSDIIAGLIIKIDDNVIDMSLKHKFEEMKKQMIK
ncbi:ATP synthase F1 subunit delta [bacterium]|nr:ATP synthase F1 subunit delta [bacterium]